MVRVVGFRGSVFREEQEDTTFAKMGGVPLFIAIVAKALLATEGHFVRGTLDEG